MSEWDYPNKAVEQRQAEIDYLRDKEAEIERLKQLISDRELLLTIEGTKALEKERDAFKAEIERLRSQLATTQYEALQRAIQFDKDVAYLHRKLERVREKISRKNTKRVQDFDDFIAELKKILDGEGGRL